MVCRVTSEVGIGTIDDMPIVRIAHLAGLQRVANELVQVSFQSMKSLAAEANPARFDQRTDADY